MQINSSYILVDNPKTLELAKINLKTATKISVDTESSGYYTYYSKVCLIQLTSNGKNYLVDPLQISQLTILGDIFANPDILKIFHSASDDIKALKRDFQFEFHNIADTMTSSRLLGMEHNSLHHLVEVYHKTQLSKTEQKSNWEKRPLDRQQLQYAALDTAYLESIWEKMEKELQDRGLYEEAISEFIRIANEPPATTKDGSSTNLAKFPNILNFTPIERMYVQEILSYREEKAMKQNKAPFRVLNNDKIAELVQKDITEENFIRILGKKDGTDLFQIVSSCKGEGIEKSELEKRHGEDLTEEESKRYKNLRKWRDVLQKVRKMDHTIVPSNRQLIVLSQSNPTTAEEIQNLDLFSDWKIKHYSPSIIAALQGKNFDHLLSGLPPVNSKRKSRGKDHAS